MKQKLLNILKDKELLYIFIYKFSVRRLFIPIIGIYYLMIADTTLSQIGIFTSIGFLFGMLLEIPSGYISDNIGHKKTLFLSKFSMMLSLIFFILGGSFLNDHSFYMFILGSAFMSMGFSFNSGTIDAYFHEILELRGEENKFTKLNSRMGGNISMISVFFLVLIPFTMKIHGLLPFIISIVLDIVGVIALLKLPNPRDSKKLITGEVQKIGSILKDSINMGFLPFSIFIGLIGGILIGKSSFDPVYLVDMGLIPIYIGLLMGTSRTIWFVLSRNIHYLEEKFSMNNLLIFQILIYTIVLLLISYFSNYLIILVLLAFMTALKHSMGSINTKYIFKNYLKNQKYKATIASIKTQIETTIGILISFVFGYIMNYSFKLGYILLSAIMLLGLSISYYYFRKNKKIELK